jgi:hypothetical protein
MFNAKTQLHKIGGGVGSLSCQASTLEEEKEAAPYEEPCLSKEKPEAQANQSCQPIEMPKGPQPKLPLVN